MAPYERRIQEVYEAVCRERARWFEMIADFVPELEPAVEAFPHAAICTVHGVREKGRLGFQDDDHGVALVLEDRAWALNGAAEIIREAWGITRREADAIVDRWSSDRRSLGDHEFYRAA